MLLYLEIERCDPEHLLHVMIVCDSVDLDSGTVMDLCVVVTGTQA